MTQKEFGLFLNLTPGAVSQMKKKKQIIMTADGKMVDTEHPVTQKQMQKTSEYKTKHPRGILAQKLKQERTGVVQTPPQQIKIEDTDVEQFNASLADWQIAKIKAQTALTNANLAEKLKQVVHRDLVDSVFGRLGGALSDHLLTMGDRLSADVAALVGTTDPAVVTEVKRLINTDVTRSLRAVQAVIVDYYEKELEV
jgi:hypothetical protein